MLRAGKHLCLEVVSYFGTMGISQILKRKYLGRILYQKENNKSCFAQENYARELYNRFALRHAVY